MFFQKLLENQLGWLLKYTMESIESSSMSHAELNELYSLLCSTFHETPQGSCAWVEPFDAEPFEVAELVSQEVDEGLVFGEPVQGGELFLFGGLLPLQSFNFFL